jgi:hypothetical protein
VKLEFDWKDPESKATYSLLRDLSWRAAQYRNDYVRAFWAESVGYRVDPEHKDKHDITKQVRANQPKLSSAVYCACENEALAVWKREAKRVMAGKPIPEWRTTASLAIRGNRKKSDSGVRIELENDQFVAYLSLRSVDSPGGCWIRLPVAKNTRRDEHQGDLLLSMISWETAIKKATLEIEPHGVTLRLTYEKKYHLPTMGNRVATLGPLMPDGRLSLRTETQRKDFTSIITSIASRKTNWDLIRRRIVAQIGWRKGHAKAKRQVLARMSWDDWLQTRLHTWSHDIIEWLVTQGVAKLQIQSIANGDWPADRLIHQLTYKGADQGISVVVDAELSTESGYRAAKAEVAKVSKKVTKRARAERELLHQLGQGSETERRIQ